MMYLEDVIEAKKDSMTAWALWNEAQDGPAWKTDALETDKSEAGRIYVEVLYKFMEDRNIPITKDKEVDKKIADYLDRIQRVQEAYESRLRHLSDDLDADLYDMAE